MDAAHRAAAAVNRDNALAALLDDLRGMIGQLGKRI
jgi:hypothetical protein